MAALLFSHITVIETILGVKYSRLEGCI